MARLKPVQAKLTQENSDYAHRAETLMTKVEEPTRALIEIKAE